MGGESILEVNKIYNGDCLELLKDIDDKSINLIIIDPPYNIGKAKWDKIDNYIEWMGTVFLECQRVLKNNGSFYFFHNDFKQMAELQHWINENTKFIYKSLITIDKIDNNYIKDLYGTQNHFRNYLNLSEYCLFYTFQDEYLNYNHSFKKVIVRKVSNFKFHRNYAERILIDIGQTIKGVEKKISSRMLEHFFSVKTEQWEMCSKKAYKKLCEIWGIDNLNYFIKYETLIKIYREEYEKLREEYEKLREEYESLRYTFNKKDGLKNVWNYSFREDKRLKHPTQKPVRLIQDIINYSSNEEDIILDCFLGSGTTAVACINTNRKYIGIEKDKTYYDIANKRINEALNK